MFEFSVHPLRGVRVLIAEDDILVALHIEEVLCRAGAEVVGLATTLRRALAAAQSAPLTFAVLDINLGYDLVFPAAHVLRDRGIGFIFHTGIDDLDSLQQDWPGVRVLGKTASDRMLIETIHGCLRLQQR